MPDGHKPATGQEIRDIMGPADDELIQEILRTGASRDEILEASEWLDDDDYMGAALERPFPARVREVYDLFREREEPDRE